MIFVIVMDKNGVRHTINAGNISSTRYYSSPTAWTVYVSEITSGTQPITTAIDCDNMEHIIHVMNKFANAAEEINEIMNEKRSA